MAKIEVKQGEKFGRLEVIKEVAPHIFPSSQKERKFLCKYGCGNTLEVLLKNLRSGHTISCGCVQKEKASTANKKFNTYEFFEDYVVGYTSKGETFKVDLEDYEKIKNYCWYLNKGYLVTNISNKIIRLHRFILNPPKELVVDHINHDATDNRKSNLRICTQAQNLRNRKAKGVYFNKLKNKWQAYISVNSKNIYLGCFNSKEGAIKARKMQKKDILVSFLIKNYCK